MAQAAGIKKLSMELGGNAPFIVFDDADLDAAVEGAIASQFRNSGQTCVCANRFFVQAGVYDAFADKFANAVALKVGNGLEPGCAGPADRRQGRREGRGAYRRRHRQGRQGARGRQAPRARRLVLRAHRGDRRHARDARRAGGDIRAARAAVPFETEEQAVAMANDTEFGLAAYFYTRDLGRAFRVIEALQYGMVGINAG